VISLLPVVYELIQARRHIKQDATTRQERDTPAGGDA